MMNSRLKQASILIGFALLTVVAAAGWMRKPDTGARGMYGQPFYGQPSAWNGGDVAYPVQQPASAVTCPEPVVVQNMAYPAQNLTSVPQYRTHSRPRVVRVVEQQPAYVERQRVVERPVRQKRSTGKSVAIVGGSAGVGAAIGALAGGGKGAAIGAISGGTAGFVYDRLTHNR